jgi:integrase
MTRKRRAPDEGTLIYDETRGLWVGRLPRSIDPKRRAVYGRTQAEARDKLRRAQRNAERGLTVLNEHTKLGEYLEAWLTSTIRKRVQAGRLAATTARSYESHVRVHLVPRLGRVPLRQLRPSHVDGMLADLQAEGRSPATAARVRATLSRALTDALRDEVVDRNVAQIAEPPRVEKRKPSAFTEDELRLILLGCAEDRLGALFLFALHSGLRSSELIGLRWDDVDLDAGTYRVTKTLHRIGKAAERVVGQTGTVEGEPKTHGSGEETPMSAAAVEILRRHRREQQRERLATRSWQDSGHVFTTTIGTHLEQSNVNRAWKALIARAGVAHKTRDGRSRGLHELRRTFATMLREAGVPLEEVQRLGRWASPQVLLDSYRATRDERLRSAADRLGDAIEGG